MVEIEGYHEGKSDINIIMVHVPFVSSMRTQLVETGVYLLGSGGELIITQLYILYFWYN